MVNLFSYEKEDLILVWKYSPRDAISENFLNIFSFLQKHFRFCFTLEVTSVFFFLKGVLFTQEIQK